MIIKYASKEDVEAISAVERECFPPSEAATEKEFIERVKHYGNHFWLMYEAEKLIAFVDGFVTDEYDLTDEMYENAAMPTQISRLARNVSIKSVTTRLSASVAGFAFLEKMCFPFTIFFIITF